MTHGLRKPSGKLSAEKEVFFFGQGLGGGHADTHIVGIVIFVVGQLDHAVGALEEGR